MKSKYEETDKFHIVKTINETFKWYLVKGYSSRWETTRDKWYCWREEVKLLDQDNFRKYYPLSSK